MKDFICVQVRLDFHRQIKNLLQRDLYPFHFKQHNKHELRRNLHLIKISNLSKQYLDNMENNIVLRKDVNNIPAIRTLVKDISLRNDPLLCDKLEAELKKLPNLTHARLIQYGDKPCELLRYFPMISSSGLTEFSEICKRLNLFRMEHLGNITGHKSYYLISYLAMLEHALIEHAITFLRKNDFKLVSVPDILPAFLIEGCGMHTAPERTQVYTLKPNMCLSGTSEMALAGIFQDRLYKKKELPIKVCAVSRCFRAETSGSHEEKGIYRVHQFNKVEMFAVCTTSQSEEIINYFKNLEISLFKNLNLTFRLLDMPPPELGAPAYEKYDIESWMSGRKIWGEISSCSNCTDYQSKRLNITYLSSNKTKFVHTVNGTAAAIPRLLISLIESNQMKASSISVPNVLQKFIKQSDVKKEKRFPELKLAKRIKH
ncbi:serine--tRNA ligase, mitochondrial isoform X2 [Teleopsis dalmanni]|uniref:serine--tRNA ligase, mitochondrial isoform X2 n=1 Tax=Teleopsis dalmanni TaxID=139649 RepID=UPI0018CC9A3D|nr:serine--tRNA ligase, mitochondrial isoform X2 [Teleopsis dalmanni]